MRKVIEVLGSPDAGKTSALSQLCEQLNSKGIKTIFVKETRGKDLFGKTERGTLEYNKKVGALTCYRVKAILDNCPDDVEVVLVDKGIVDYKYFCEHYFLTGKASYFEAIEASTLYDKYDIMPDEIVVLTCSPEMAELRCKEPVSSRTVRIQQAIDSLSLFYDSWDETPKYWLDTTLLNLDDTVEFLHSIV